MSGDVTEKRVPEEAFCLRGQKLLPQGRALSPTCSSITVSRELPVGSGFLARGDGRPGMQVGPETDQCVDREVETRDAHIPSSMWRVHYHSRICESAVGIAGGRAASHRVCPI
ncbi:hypothetical protein Gotur_008152 [Gossypium turneri]